MRTTAIRIALAAAVLVVVVKIAGKAAPAMRARCAQACERMLAKMPESFPPNRMLADLESIKEQTSHILSLLESPADDEARDTAPTTPDVRSA